MTGVVQLVEGQSAGPEDSDLLRRPLTETARSLLAAEGLGERIRVTELRNGVRIEATSYVGAVHLDGLVVQVRPKIAPEVVPTFLRYALDLPVSSPQGRTNTPTARWGLMNLVGLILLEEIDAVLLAGLFQDYRRAEEWLGFLRGQIQFRQLARRPAAPRVALPCRYFERTPDTILNRVALATLATLRPLVLSRGLQMELQSRESLLQDFCSRANLAPTLVADAEADIDRRSSYYEPIVSLAGLVLEASGGAFWSDQETRLPCFLLDMNRLFERFVARLCRDHLPSGVTIDEQPTRRDLFRYAANPRAWSRPTVQPDAVVRDQRGKPVLVIDTKYKLLDGVPPPAEDLYQVAIYSMGFGASSWVPARIVYPTSGRPPAETVLRFVGAGGRSILGEVTVCGVDLLACADAIRRQDRASIRGIVGELTTPPAV